MLPNTAKFLSNENTHTAAISSLERAFWNCVLPSNIITALHHNLHHPGMPPKLCVEGLSWILYTPRPQLSVNSFHNGIEGDVAFANATRIWLPSTGIWLWEHCIQTNYFSGNILQLWRSRAGYPVKLFFNPFWRCQPSTWLTSFNALSSENTQTENQCCEH